MIKKSLGFVLLSNLILLNNLNFIFAKTQEKVLTTSEINKIVENKDNIYGLPNKYWNEKTCEFIIPDGYTKIEEGALPSDKYFSYTKNKTQREKCLILKSVKKVVIPNTVKYIDEGALCGSSIEKIDLPESLKYIGKGNFSETKIKELK